jgi:hypothetical protein
MTVYIGVDFHARQQTISYLTTEEGEIRRLQLDHGKPDEVRRFYEQFGGQQVIVGFESSGYAPGSRNWRNWVTRFGLVMPRRSACLRGGGRRTIGEMLI